MRLELRKELLRRRQELQHMEMARREPVAERVAVPESFQWLRRLPAQQRGRLARCSSPGAALRSLKQEAPRGVLEAGAVAKALKEVLRSIFQCPNRL